MEPSLSSQSCLDGGAEGDGVAQSLTTPRCAAAACVARCRHIQFGLVVAPKLTHAISAVAYLMHSARTAFTYGMHVACLHASCRYSACPSSGESGGKRCRAGAYCVRRPRPPRFRAASSRLR